MTFSRGSRGRLTARDVGRFAGATLFDRVGRAVCAAGCLPRKELYEAWEVARRARRLFRGGPVVDVAGGHGLLAYLMLILDDTSPAAFVVDPKPPSSAAALHRELVRAWPRLDGRVTMHGDLESLDIRPEAVIVSSHACGRLTDVVLDRAAAAGARVAVLPCCHDFAACDSGGLEGWLDRALAIDVVRAARLQARGYRIWTQAIPAEITPKNRLLLAAPVPPGSQDSLGVRSVIRTHMGSGL